MSDFTATQMHWKPALMRLTQIAHPDMDGGEPTPCYLDPHTILSINRLMSSFSKENTETYALDVSKREYHPRIACTCVTTTYGHALMVTETPEVVAMLRDRALGFEHKPKAHQ